MCVDWTPVVVRRQQIGPIYVARMTEMETRVRTLDIKRTYICGRER